MSWNETSLSSANVLLAPLMRLLWLPVTSSVDKSSSETNQKYKRLWTKEQVESLVRTCRDYAAVMGKSMEELTPIDFECIASAFPQTTSQCMVKFQEVHSAGTMIPGVWSPEEDRMLIELRQNTRNKWGKIAKELNRALHKHIPVRTGKKCKERWNNYLDPNIKRDKWTPEEDLSIIQGYIQHGKKWTVITHSVVGRTQGQVKNRVNSLLNKERQSVGNQDDSALAGIIMEKLYIKLGISQSVENAPNGIDNV